MTVSAPQRTDQCSFSTSSSVDDETGEAPMLALILVLAGAADRHRIELKAQVDHVGGDDQAARGDLVPHLLGASGAARARRPGASRVTAEARRLELRHRPEARRAAPAAVGLAVAPPTRGKKSQAVLSLGAGMPGVSGDEKLSGPPMSGGLAKEPGLVPSRKLDGLWLTRGVHG